MSFSCELSLTTALFTIFFALSAYLRVLNDSSWLSKAGLIAHIMIVFELPPRAFYNIRVRLESLYGTIVFLAFPEDLSAKILMQFPRTVKLLLIAHPSFSL